MRILLSKKETAALIGVHPEHLMRLARQGKFCQAIKLGDGAGCAVRFDQAEVDAWIEKRALARSADAPLPIAAMERLLDSVSSTPASVTP
jgi:predicted DNA-binding transcriptional regulator AlpA